MIQVEVMNQQALTALIKDLGDIPHKLGSNGRLRRALEAIRDNVIIPSYEEEFAAGGKVEPWEPITANTALISRQQNKGFTFSQEDISTVSTAGLIPLTDRGVFARSARAKGRFHIRDNRMGYGNFPSNMWWWAVHDQGLAENTWPFIPRRTWTLQFTRVSGDVDTIIDITWDYVKDAINAAMPRLVYK